MTAEQPPTPEHWLTYADAAERLGLTPEAVRALARRQHWPRRSPNAVGGQTWILVPANRLAAVPANGHGDSGRRTLLANGRRANPQEIALAGGQSDDSHRTLPGAPPDTGDYNDRRPPPDTEDSDRRLGEVLTAVREAVETIAQAQSMQYDALCREAMQQPLRDQLGIANQQIATLTTQLGMAHEQADRERERADRAEVRAQEAESRATEFQQQLQTEMIEHRRVIATLANQLAARRSWWPFRRVRQKSL